MDQTWYQNFVADENLSRDMLFELLTAANFMGIKPLLDLSPDDFQEQYDAKERDLQRVAEEVFEFEKVFFPRPEGQPASESPNAKGIIGENVDALNQYP